MCGSLGFLALLSLVHQRLATNCPVTAAHPNTKPPAAPQSGSAIVDKGCRAGAVEAWILQHNGLPRSQAVPLEEIALLAGWKPIMIGLERRNQRCQKSPRFTPSRKTIITTTINAVQAAKYRLPTACTATVESHCAGIARSSTTRGNSFPRLVKC